MTIQIDTREKVKNRLRREAGFKKAGVDFFEEKLDEGDYCDIENPSLVIDRKYDLMELCNNLSDNPAKDSNGKVLRDSHGRRIVELDRFTRELQRAKDKGIHLVILCEHGGSIRTIEDVRSWVNPRLAQHPMTISGERLYKKLIVLSNTYGFDIEFCTKKETAQRIIEILEKGKVHKVE